VNLSLVIPVLNEAEALPLLFQAIFPVIDPLDCHCEVLFVNDGSTDETLDILSRAACADPRIKVLSFSATSVTRPPSPPALTSPPAMP
jgi:glycosyltransferase involved in cell wall biosynthesis